MFLKKKIIRKQLRYALWCNGVTEKLNKNKRRESVIRESGSSIDAQFGKAGFRRRRQWLCLRSFRNINAFWVIEFTRNCRTRRVQTRASTSYDKSKENFLFTFSTDVSQPGTEIVQGEYQIDKRWSVSVARDETGGVSVDGRYHTKF